METLTEGLLLRFGVVQIKHSADSFQKKPSMIMAYCHFMTLEPTTWESGQIEAQICTEEKTLTYFAEGDIVALKVGKYNEAKKRYTMTFVEIIKQGGFKKAVAERAIKDVGIANRVDDFPPLNNINQDPTYKAFFNPNVQGSATERALAHACHLYQMQGNITAETVLASAEKFRKFLLEGNKL